MTSQPDNPRAAALARARYQAALASAIVAGAFCLIVGGILLAAHLRGAAVELNKSEELTDLRANLIKATDPAQRATLLEEIRRRDLALRQDYFGPQTFARRGGMLLAGGAVVFLIAASRVAAYRKGLPMPGRNGEKKMKATAAAAIARWSVAGVAVAVLGGGMLLVVSSENPLNGQAPPSPAAGGPENPAPAPAAATDPNAGAPATPAVVAQNWPTPEEIAKQWPRFRGPGGLGISAYTNVPATWNGKTGENILWKSPVPLPGWNSPIVWGNRIFLTGATDARHEVYCYDAATGKLVWTQQVKPLAPAGTEAPEVMEETGHAAATAATDGRYVCAIFATGEIACFDVAGKPAWSKYLGRFKQSYGYSNSLHIYKNTVIVVLDQGDGSKVESRLLALDLATGKTAWEAPRQVPASWASPILYNTGQREELVIPAKPWVTAYDPATGKELWRAGVLDGDVAPSPAFAGGLVLAAQQGSKLAAIRAGGSGDVTATAVAWSAEDNLPDIVSPATDGKIVLTSTTEGMLTCYSLADGKKGWEKELDDTVIKSSPVMVGDKIYLMAVVQRPRAAAPDSAPAAGAPAAGDAAEKHSGKVEVGVMLILAASAEEYKELGRPELDEPVYSSPAMLDGRIYIRGQTHLYCIGKK